MMTVSVKRGKEERGKERGDGKEKEEPKQQTTNNKQPRKQYIKGKILKMVRIYMNTLLLLAAPTRRNHRTSARNDK